MCVMQVCNWTGKGLEVGGFGGWDVDYPLVCYVCCSCAAADRQATGTSVWGRGG